MNATNAVVEGKMEPIGKAAIGPQVVVTGQFLYDTFVQANEAEITRMNHIRALAVTADALQIKGACDKMVEHARAVDYPLGKEKGNERGPKEQQAMNVRTIVQQAWGAIKFATPALMALGYDDSTGYQAMRVLAKRALVEAGKTWQGFDIPTERVKADKAATRRNKEETKALVEVQKDNPRLVGESLADWNDRVFALAEQAMIAAKEESERALAESEVKRILEKHGEAIAERVAFALLNALGIEYQQSEEMTEEKANALLKAAGDAEELERIEQAA